MNGQTVSQKPTIVQIIAIVGAVILAAAGMFALGWCAIWKIYVDSPLLISISNITSGIGGAITTILVGRTISQLNQPDEPIPTQITNPPNHPVPVAAVEPKTEVQP